jgi:glycine dehydrogenase
VMTTMIGLGYYGTHTPQVVLRKVLENPAWYTAYTPYQPEISQGRLEALLNYQTMICDLTGLPLANSSLLDEATAAAEAMTVARRVSKAASNRFAVDLDLFPQTLATLQTRAEPLGIEIVQADLAAGLPAGGCFGVLAQYPGASGLVRDLEPLAEAAHAEGALLCAAADLLALVLLKPPGEMGADVVVGTSQRFGVPIGFGGPHAAYMSVRSGLERALPGRLVGLSIDADGNPALRLALQTREQHIRREKATSNICTAQALNALAGVVYLTWLGRRGIVELGELLLARTHYARETLGGLPGVEKLHEQPVVREFALRLTSADGGSVLDVAGVRRRCLARNVNPGVDAHALTGREQDRGVLLVAITAKRSRADIDRLAQALGAAVADERDRGDDPAPLAGEAVVV